MKSINETIEAHKDLISDLCEGEAYESNLDLVDYDYCLLILSYLEAAINILAFIMDAAPESKARFYNTIKTFIDNKLKILKNDYEI